jgi:hypothetical protein
MELSHSQRLLDLSFRGCVSCITAIQGAVLSSHNKRDANQVINHCNEPLRITRSLK